MLKYRAEGRYWVIGPVNKLGSYTGHMYTDDYFGDPTNERNTWYFWKGHQWNRPTIPSSIMVQCNKKKCKTF